MGQGHQGKKGKSHKNVYALFMSTQAAAYHTVKQLFPTSQDIV